MAMTFVAPPRANSERARFSTPIAVLRSPSPIITAPLPSTWMSPPSSVAGWCDASSPPYQMSKSCSANIGWNR